MMDRVLIVAAALLVGTASHAQPPRIDGSRPSRPDPQMTIRQTLDGPKSVRAGSTTTAPHACAPATPLGAQGTAFAGPDKKTLYVVGGGAAYKIAMLAQGVKERAK